MSPTPTLRAAGCFVTDLHDLRPTQTRAFYLALFAAVFALSCGGSSPVSPTPPPQQGTGPSTTAPTGQAPALFKGFAVLLPDEGPFAAVAAAPNGERLGVTTAPRGVGRFGRVTSAVLTLPGDQTLVVFTGGDGLPETTVVGNVVIRFENYTDNAVDVAVHTSNGSVTTVRSVPVDPQMLSQLRASNAFLASVEPPRIHQSLTFLGFDIPASQLVKVAGLTFGLGACLAAGSAALASAGLALPAVLFSCGSVIASGLALINPELDSPYLEAAQQGASLAFCPTPAGIADCVQVVITASAQILALAEALRSVPMPSTTLNGRWVGRTPALGIRFESASRCSVDATLDFNQNNGTITVGRASTASGNGPCTEAFLYSLSAQQELSLTSPVSGSYTNGRVALNAYFRDLPPTPSAAGRARALLMSGTASGSRLDLSGTFFDSRAWTDSDRDGQPDCDFQNPAANGECGGQGSAPSLRMTLTALRQ